MAAVQGLVGRKTIPSLTDLSTLCTKGMAAIIFPCSYASSTVCFKSRSFDRMGLLRVSVSCPSHRPRFFRRLRSEEEVLTRSLTSNRFVFRIVVATMDRYRGGAWRPSRSERYRWWKLASCEARLTTR